MKRRPFLTRALRAELLALAAITGRAEIALAFVFLLELDDRAPLGDACEVVMDAVTKIGAEMNETADDAAEHSGGRAPDIVAWSARDVARSARLVVALMARLEAWARERAGATPSAAEPPSADTPPLSAGRTTPPCPPGGQAPAVRTFQRARDAAPS